MSSPLQSVVKHAAEKGEDIQGFDHLFPVFEESDAQGNLVRVHHPIPFKQLKELKTACVQCGPTAPFTQAMLENMSTDALPPADWKQLAKACLSGWGGNYLFWKSEFVECCQVTVKINRANCIPGNLDMLAGIGAYEDLANQLNYQPSTYAQINTTAKKAWYKLLDSGRKTEDLSKIRQGADELYQDFVAWLLQEAGRLIGDNEAGTVLVKQLAYENTNSVCQIAIHPFRKKATLQDYIRLCSDIGPRYVQGLTMATALQHRAVKDVLFQQTRGTVSSGACYGCGKKGHMIQHCPQLRGNGNWSREQ